MSDYPSYISKANEKFWDADFYSHSPDTEVYRDTTPEEAIDDFLDTVHPEQPVSVVLYAVRRVELAENDPDPGRLLEDLLEQLDEEYNSGDEATVPTIAMKEAALEFAAKIREHYVPWNCEPCGSAEVDLVAYRLEQEK